MNVSLLSLVMTIGQPVMPAVPPPTLQPAPLLFVKFHAPGESKITWYPGMEAATTTKETVGLRPGYPYRLEVSQIPGQKNLKLYPSLEIRGTLVPRPGLDVSKHPVPITLTESDIDKIVDGRLVTKYYFLEDPEKASPIAASPDEPLEFKAINEVEAIKEARFRGRPMLVLRVGERPYSADELKRENVAGTILFAGAKTMPMPAYPPIFPFGGIPVYDPIVGRRGASEECLHDGGDVKARVGVGPDGKIRGLDPSDTVIHFTNPRGNPRVAISNQVCICVPRFAAAVVDIGFAAHHTMRGPQAGFHLQPISAVVARTGVTESLGGDKIAGVIGSSRASGIEMVHGPIVLEQLIGKPQGMYSFKGVAAVATLIGVDEITSFPNAGSLLLQKRVEPVNPQKIGEEVTFFLRFTNATKEPMLSVVISDSLTARLEYVEGTAKCSRPATFTTTANEAGSLILRWALDNKLQPGEDGIISFKAKIR